jgi:hypothetical protein
MHLRSAVGTSWMSAIETQIELPGNQQMDRDAIHSEGALPFRSQQ